MTDDKASILFLLTQISKKTPVNLFVSEVGKKLRKYEYERHFRLLAIVIVFRVC